jgi:HPt (histidine-containing phosphotransfer) domain-containing protein
MDESPLIDPATIRTLRALNTDGNDDFLREIVALFAADVPARLAEIDRSFAEGNAPAFQRAAHSIKGSAANLGATRVRAVAERLETRSQRQGLAGAEPIIRELKEEAALAQAELQRILEASSGRG